MDIVAVCVIRVSPSDLHCGMTGIFASQKYLTPNYNAGARLLRVKKRFHSLKNKTIHPGKVLTRLILAPPDHHHLSVFSAMFLFHVCL